MATSELSMGKSIAVLAIVVGCFTVLWPKIFYPMMQAAFSMTSPDYSRDDDDLQGSHPPHLVPGKMDPHMKEAMGQARPSDKARARESRPFPHPSVRQPPKQVQKTGGAMNFIMPMYTIGIVVFFLYTVLKLVCKKKPEDESVPPMRDYRYESRQQEGHCYAYCDSHEQKRAPEPDLKRRRKRNLGTKQLLEEIGRCRESLGKGVDERDLEISRLRQRLEETEYLMEQIMRHMQERLCAGTQDGEKLTAAASAEEKMCTEPDGELRRRKPAGVHEEASSKDVAPDERTTASGPCKRSRPRFEGPADVDRIDEENCEETDDGAASEDRTREPRTAEDLGSELEASSSDAEACCEDR